MYILDTSILTLINYQHQQVMDQLDKHKDSTLATTSVSLEEQLSGWYSLMRQAKNNLQLSQASSGLADAVMLFNQFQIVPDTAQSLDHADQLIKRKLNIGKRDTRIATITLQLNATVVTQNVRDFARVPGLKIEDWST